ncbi:MAG: peptidylprolyl isomerase [Kiritimatiellaeota bacterium]|nr:peptidylprolyl isomerase [Kiritimatiellota bacterium]
MHVRLSVMLAAIAVAGLAVRAADEKKPETPPPALAPLPVMPELKIVAPTTVVALVNGVEIRQSAVNERLDKVMTMLGGRIPAEKQGMFRAQVSGRVLDEMVMQTLLLAAADKAKIEVTSEDTAKALKDLPIPPGQTVEQTYLAQGMTKAEFEKELSTGLRIQKLLEKQTAGVAKVTDADVKKFSDENKEKMDQPETVTARHILVKTEKDADDKAKKAAKDKAEDLRKQLQKGADFAKLAKENSDDPGSKNTGGEYTFPRGQMVPAFENAAFTQALKEIGPLVETPFGFHIIQTLSKNPGKTATLDEVKADILKHLDNQGKGSVVQKYIEELRSKADIKYPGQQK